jgi:hypothetical protein
MLVPAEGKDLLVGLFKTAVAFVEVPMLLEKCEEASGQAHSQQRN